MSSIIGRRTPFARCSTKANCSCWRISPPMGCWETADVAMEPRYLSPNGTIYLVTGGGGWSLYPIWQCDLRLAAGEERFHTVIVDIVGGELTLSAVDKEGVVFDTMSITKTLPIGGKGE